MKPAPLPENIGDLIGRIVRVHNDTAERMRIMGEALYWIVGNSDLTSEVNRRAREALHDFHPARLDAGGGS